MQLRCVTFVSAEAHRRSFGSGAYMGMTGSIRAGVTVYSGTRTECRRQDGELGSSPGESCSNSARMCMCLRAGLNPGSRFGSMQRNSSGGLRVPQLLTLALGGLGRTCPFGGRPVSTWPRGSRVWCASLRKCPSRVLAKPIRFRERLAHFVNL